MSDRSPVAGKAAGVPYLAFRPADSAGPSGSIVIAWHLMDPPRTEAAFAAALPLDGLDAWRIYLGLPLTGARMPPGGPEEIMRLGMDDVVRNLYDPIISGAAAEFPSALADLRQQFGLESERVGLLGGSAGAAVAQLVMAEGSVEVAAAVLVSPLIRVRSAVTAGERLFGLSYPWTDTSNAVADRIDFVARAGEIAARNSQPPIMVVIGDQDDEAFRDAASELHVALNDLYGDKDRTRLVTIPGMPHALTDEPGIEPAPQNANAAKVDWFAVEWFREHLIAG